MKKIIIFFLLLFPFSCSSLKNFGYQVELYSFVKKFEEECNCKVDVPISIEKIASDEKGYKTLGVCYGFRMPKFFRSIKIDRSYWAEATFYEKEATIYHELAHCVLDLEHTNEWIDGYLIFGRPKSLMYPYSFPQYESFRKEYIKELFSRKPGEWLY
jgi:hypothetical protein